VLEVLAEYKLRSRNRRLVAECPKTRIGCCCRVARGRFQQDAVASAGTCQP